jgi:ribosomal protein S18 acetylase RimI-like enzyme
MEDFGFCLRLYLVGTANISRELRLDPAVLSENLRRRWKVAEVEIITCDGADVGWMQSAAQDGALFLGQIFVETAFQRRGIGTSVLDRLIARADRAAQPVTLGVVKSNPARALYERLGFRITHQDDRKFYMRREAGAANSYF